MTLFCENAISQKFTDSGEAQDILHRAGKMSSRRVFGGEVVEAAVDVRTTGCGVIMALAPAQALAATAEKGAGACFA